MLKANTHASLERDSIFKVIQKMYVLIGSEHILIIFLSCVPLDVFDGCEIKGCGCCGGSNSQHKPTVSGCKNAN